MDSSPDSNCSSSKKSFPRAKIQGRYRKKGLGFSSRPKKAKSDVIDVDKFSPSIASKPSAVIPKKYPSYASALKAS